MGLTDYTSYSQVRTVCGLTIHDISDEMLGYPVFSNELYVSMSSVTLPDSDPGPGSLIDRFSEITLIAENSRTEKEKLLLALTNLYATYVVADSVCKALPMIAAKSRTDGKTTDTRFSTDLAFMSVKKDIADKLSSYKRQIENINNTDSISYKLVTVVKPNIDVVTNE